MPLQHLPAAFAASSSLSVRVRGGAVGAVGLEAPAAAVPEDWEGGTSEMSEGGGAVCVAAPAAAQGWPIGRGKGALAPGLQERGPWPMIFLHT
jgi:hypothetical protein